MLLLAALLLAGTPSVRVDPGAPGIEIGDTAKPEDRDAILQAVDKGLAPVRACWKDALEKRSRLRGTVLVVFTVLPDGSVSRPVVKEDELNEKKTVDCLTKKLSELAVPLSDQTVRVVIPVSFRNGSDALPAPSAGGTPASESAVKDDLAAIDATLAGLNFRWGACHEKALRRDPSVYGTLVVDFAVEENAQIRTATVSGGTIADHTMMECVIGSIKGTPFPRPQSGRVLVRRTFTFDGKSPIFTASPAPTPK